jgi:hypothetical protein
LRGHPAAPYPLRPDPRQPPSAPLPPNLTADDLKPLLEKLSREERLRLARLALGTSLLGESDAGAYALQKPGADESADVDRGLGWEAGGWEEFDAAR